MRFWRTVPAWLGLLALPATHLSANDVLSVTFYHYPPKLVVTDGEPGGPRIDELNGIAAKAGLTINWVKSSIEEEAAMLDAARRPFCATGRSYTPKRGKAWQFIPYYLDALPPQLIVARQETVAALRERGDIGAILRDSSLTAVLLPNYVYGPVIDPVLTERHPWISQKAKMLVQSLDMVRQGRVHYTIVPGHRWGAYMADHPDATDLVSISDLGTLPEDPLYIACSKATPHETLEALSDAMKALGYKPANLPQAGPGQ